VRYASGNVAWCNHCLNDCLPPCDCPCHLPPAETQTHVSKKARRLTHGDK
jgi:hypothetical protein